jgi:hypothetical protein
MGLKIETNPIKIQIKSFKRCHIWLFSTSVAPHSASHELQDFIHPFPSGTDPRIWILPVFEKIPQD